ncbi:MAG: SRPBCC domain-containing protein [Minwuiales bacterium]|nr:SRPBCC domain-containing protein [Minwuiales bacterium]
MNEIYDTDEGRTLTMRRTFAADRERVFRAFSEGAQMAEWFGPEGCTCRVSEYDCRPGGAYYLEIVTPEGKPIPLSGAFREVSPPDRLVYTWMWGGDGNMAGLETLVTLDFVERDDGTELRLTHSRLQSDEQAESHRGGWASSWNKLARLVEG